MGKTIKRVHRRYQRLRPEFRRNLTPDRATIEGALRELIPEVSVHDLVRRWIPRLRAALPGSSWSQALAAAGYAPAPAATPSGTAPTVAMAPLVEHARLRRSLERFCRELGVRVVSTGEQLASLGHERLERIHALAEAPERLESYLRAVVSRRIDTLVVPVGEEADGLGARVQLLAAEAAGRAAELPRLACIRLEGSRRELRARLIELGVALTGDPARAELACDRALALV